MLTKETIEAVKKMLDTATDYASKGYMLDTQKIKLLLKTILDQSIPVENCVIPKIAEVLTEVEELLEYMHEMTVVPNNKIEHYTNFYLNTTNRIDEIKSNFSE